MKIFWHKAARDDFAAIRLHYDQIEPGIAEQLITTIFAATRHLARFPELGRPGRVRDTLELPVKGTKFIVAYMRAGDRLVVLAVYHAAREWPETWLRAAVKAGAKGSGSSFVDTKRAIAEAQPDDRPDGTGKQGEGSASSETA